MAVTRSTAQDRPQIQRAVGPRSWRTTELGFTLLAAVLVAAGLFQVHRAKAQPLPQIEHDLTAKRLLNLNDLGAREDLLPALTPFFPKMRDRDEVARKIYYLSGTLSNVGAIQRQKLLSGDQFRQLK